MTIAPAPVAVEVGRRTRFLGRSDLPALGRRYPFPAGSLADIALVAEVFPFRVSVHVLERLVDWSDVPADPMFRLVFPQPGMLADGELALLRQLRTDGSPDAFREVVTRIRRSRNPHPDGQVELNAVAPTDASPGGLQQQYRTTVLFFPRGGQTCHSYCTYCFRWAQFIGDGSLRFSEGDPGTLMRFLDAHPEVTDVLFTGGDPLVMRTGSLRRFVEPLLSQPGVRTIRFGTKALSHHPDRLLEGHDAEDLLALLASIERSGRRAVVVAHVTHPREVEDDRTRNAIGRVLGTGASVYTQAPLVRTINDDADLWRSMWTTQLALGCVPYYMFVERQTGAAHHFSVPLERAHEIFRSAYASLPGLARTVRGPVMSTADGKVVVDGVLDGGAHARTFVLRFLQARDEHRVGQPFLAEGAASATWIDQLRPVGWGSAPPAGPGDS